MATDNDGTTDRGDGQGPDSERRRATRHRRSRIRVLHVDDTPDIVEMNRRHLEQYDERIELEPARNATEGLQRLDAGEFDCIVSDFEMPGMNGLEFLEHIRKEDRELPFIFYTSKPCDDVVTEALSAGVTDYVQKGRGTGNLVVLANTIVTAVESWRTQRTRNRLLDAVAVFEAGIALLDRDDRFTYVSDSYADHVGSDTDELVGKHIGCIYEENPDFHGELRPEVDDANRSTTTLLTDDDDAATEHLLLKTAHDGLVCAVPPNGSESTSGE